jgi:hypothetical protein
MTQFKSIGIAGLVCVLGGLSVPAAAQSSVPGPAASVELTITTAIAPRCGWSSSGAPASNVTLGSLDSTGNKDIPFEIDCNTPFLFSATSLNQTLAQEASIEDLPALFTQTIDYRVGVRIGVRNVDGTAGIVSANCSSASLTLEGMCPFAVGSPGQDSFTGESIATAADTALPRSRLRISWTGQSASEATRVAGTYSDVLTVSVQAKS